MRKRQQQAWPSLLSLLSWLLEPVPKQQVPKRQVRKQQVRQQRKRKQRTGRRSGQRSGFSFFEVSQ